MIKLLVEVILFALGSFLVALSGALVPGPMLTVTISNSLEKGTIAGPLVVVGHVMTEIGLLLLLILGLGWVLESNTATILIGTIGGVVLIYMGYQISQSSPPHLQENKEAPHKYGSVFSGILSSVSNPYFFIWWATIGWAFLLKGMALAGVAGIIGFLVGHWAADLGIYSAVSVFTSKGSELITEKHYKILMYSCGAFMIILGIYFIYNSQIGFLIG
ncbi:MAG: LysE family transporter [Methanobacteriaceae archaeon]|nr:LysE family transporter [Methanobacteriaceae archaeon]